MPEKTQWPHKRVLWIGVGLFVCAAAGLLAYPLIGRNRDATCKANLRQIVLALHNYHREHGLYPPAYTLGPDGKPWHSWRVLILPQLGEDKLYREYRFDEPWDSDHNRALVRRMPAALGCPSSRAAAGTTQYLAVVGELTAWPGPTAMDDMMFPHERQPLDCTLCLLEADESDVFWIEPRDLSVEAALKVFESPPPHRHVAMYDGSVKTLSPTVGQELFLAWLSIGWRHSMGPQDRLPQWLRGKLPAEIASWGPTKEASELESTEIVGAASLPLNPQKSQIWCATFQMAWDQLRQKRGGAEVNLQPAIPLSEALNKHPFPAQALAPECVLIDAATPGPEDDRRLRAEFAERFPQAPVQIEDSLADPRRLRMYAYMEKRLLFFEGLERFPEPLQFGTSPSVAVESFGVKANESAGEETRVLENEVFIRDYLSDANFIIELATESKRRDRVILAKVDPLESLAATWSHVEQRIKTPDSRHHQPSLLAPERFQAPVLAFNFHRDYQELVDQWVRDSDTQIKVARQSIRFRLDERGATLISLAETGSFTLDGGTPRRFVFDSPFLLALREGDNEPYFLAWIATAEVMEKKE
jgi:hypothetical protein